jgi:hypothetical protein
MFQCYLCSKQFTRKWVCLLTVKGISSPTELLLSDLLHAHLRRHEKSEKNLPATTTRRNLTESPERTSNRKQSQRVSRPSLTSPYNPLEESWPAPIEQSSMVRDYGSNQIDASQSLELPNSTFPTPVDRITAPQPSLSSSSSWDIAPALDNELSSTTEFPWTFQDGGIFGLPNEIYPDITRDKYLHPFGDDYYQTHEHGSAYSWGCVSMSRSQFYNNFSLTRACQETEPVQPDRIESAVLSQERIMFAGDYDKILAEFPVR